MLLKYQVTKTYGPELGLSACFRQPKAKSHCRFLHGYALSFKFVFEADELDENDWVIDFGALKRLKAHLVNTFDHRTLISVDDPQLEMFLKLHEAQVADVLVLPEGVGCEAFARLGLKLADRVVKDLGINDRVKVRSCEVREHGANSAICKAEEVL
jgi:6-pyruvoyltetrahydropterin/6-carboxytetrahydropterin synthase